MARYPVSRWRNAARLSHPARFASLLATLVLLLAPFPGQAVEPRSGASLDGAEAQFRLVLENIRRERLTSALSEVDRLIVRYPNFRLAHLIRGDLLMARAKPIVQIADTGHAARERIDELRAEALARVRAYSNHPAADLVPRALLRFSPAQEHAIVIDASLSRVYVYENAGGTPRFVEDFYSTLGKYGIEKDREGDKKTPVGVYRVTSQIPGAKLPDLYGWGAFPIDYPNEWDRRLGKTGYGIWLHGVPSDTYARAPRASDGCVALANPDVENLGKRVQVGLTPVIIADRVEWVTPAASRAEREAFLSRIESWREAWESRDAERYLAHYAREFRSAGMDLATWGTHKRRVNAAKRWVKVSLGDLSVFRNPGERDLMVVTFDQDYRSSNLSQKTRKRQFWVMEDGSWKIAFEAPARGVKLALPESFPRGSR